MNTVSHSPTPVHPWFSSPLKRKLYESEAENFNLQNPWNLIDSPSKRRRRAYESTIEGGMAEMTIRSPTSYPFLPTSYPQSHAPVLPYPQYNTASRQRPAESREPHASVETAEPIKEVRMKGSSWYEPVKDRIVVTDLDSDSEDENEVPETAQTIAELARGSVDEAVERYSIPAILARIPIPRPVLPLPQRNREEDNSRALVLF